jgi:Rod binding domain-containing protein
MSAFGSGVSGVGAALAAQSDQVVQQATLLGKAGSPAKSSDAKIEKSAKDFESILLGNWLQGAEESFASVPGGDEDADADAGKDSFQGIAMQSLGSSMAASGGIGIAKMISKQLHKSDSASAAAASEGVGK